MERKAGNIYDVVIVNRLKYLLTFKMLVLLDLTCE